MTNKIEQLIIKIYKEWKVYDKDNNEYKLTGSIKRNEGELLKKIIIETKSKKCLEIGLAYGLSTLYILLGLNEINKNGDYKLTSIDPNQLTQWHGVGINNVEKVEEKSHHKLIKGKSYNVLPKLLNLKKKYDLIFIDGWHTFDFTLIDFFYSDLMLKIGGYIVVDDKRHKGVNKFHQYVITNYKHYKYYDINETMGVYQKLSEDKRDWNFHNNF
jgi:predicted O-methyltransferase YrrM